MAQHYSLPQYSDAKSGTTTTIIAYRESILYAYASAINSRRLAWDDPLYLATDDIENFKGTVRSPFEMDANGKDFRSNFDLFVQDFPDYQIKAFVDQYGN